MNRQIIIEKINLVIRKYDPNYFIKKGVLRNGIFCLAKKDFECPQDWFLLLRNLYKWDYSNCDNSVLYLDFDNDILFGGVYNILTGTRVTKVILFDNHHQSGPYIYTDAEFQKLKTAFNERLYELQHNGGRQDGS